MISSINSKSVETIVNKSVDSSMTVFRLHKELHDAVATITGHRPDIKDRIYIEYNSGVGTFKVHAHYQGKVLYGEVQEKDLGLGIINAYMNAYNILKHNPAIFRIS